MGAGPQAGPGATLRSAGLFDVYRPKALRAGEEAPAGGLAQGEKSLAVRLTLQNRIPDLMQVCDLNRQIRIGG